ncbi:virulence factor SrfC family protein [Dongia sp. agr-C8]
MTDSLSSTGTALGQAIGGAIDWVQDARTNAKSVEREADPTIESLRRIRNKSRRLAKAASRPPAIGIFGISQAGKSFLVDSLSKGENGRVESMFGNTRLDFMKHVNPPGGGKEATGLVTRFTRTRSKAPADFPVEVELVSEADLIKILWNSYIRDFDQEAMTARVEAENIDEVLRRVGPQRQAAPVPGLTADDVVDLMDYFDRLSRKTSQSLRGAYWPNAIELAPNLLPAARADLFGLLWGGLEQLSDLYRALQAGLAEVDHARSLHCELAALVEGDESGEFSQAKCINNVDCLRLLDGDGGDLVKVRPVLEAGHGVVKQLPRGLLAGVTAELRFTLTEKPVAAVLESTDLIDFPGYRGRLKITDPKRELLSATEEREDGYHVSDIWLRGKVSYLFERYTEDQEMNALVLCAPSTKQSDVQDIGPVLDDWVRTVQGETPQIRARRPSGLLVVTTMWDLRLLPTANETPETLRVAGDAVMHMTFERFRTYDWVRDWDGRPFRNLFLTRKPRVESLLFGMRDGHETGVVTSQLGRLAQIRDYFLAGDEVLKHVAEPADAWDAMLAPNDGGVGRIVKYLESIGIGKLKTQRLQEQLLSLVTETRAKLEIFHVGIGGEELETKRKRAEWLVGAIADNEPPRFAELLDVLLLDAEQMRSCYLSIDTRGGLTNGKSATGSLRDLLKSKGASAAPAPSNRARHFADVVIAAWVNQLRDLPHNEKQLRHVRLQAEAARVIVEEMIAGALRTRLPDQIAQACSATEMSATRRRAQVAEEQVLIARQELATFTSYLGALNRPRPMNLVVGNRRIFETQKAPIALPELDEADHGAHALLLMSDWLTALHDLVIENAGFSEGSELSPAQARTLAAIVAAVDVQARALVQ